MLLTATPALFAATDLTTPIYYIALDVDKTPVAGRQVLDYPEICITLPEVNNRFNNRLPASDRLSNGLSGPGRIMFRNREGKTRVIWKPAPGRVATPSDLRLSPDGRLLAFTIYTGTEWQRECGSGNLTVAGRGAGARIAVHDLETGNTLEWKNAPGETHALTPAIINQGGRLVVMFASDRDGERTPILTGGPAPTGPSPGGGPVLKTYVAELDGSNPVLTGHHDIVAAYGFFQLADGRVVSSMAPWMHDKAMRGDGAVYANGLSTLTNIWEVWATDPSGGSQETLFGAHWSGKALHFFGQLSDGRLCTTEYYRGNYQNGAGNIWCWTPYPGFTIEGIPVSEAQRGGGRNDNPRGALIPRDIVKATAWASSEDQYARWDGSRSRFIGRIRDPAGLPGGALMFSWCKGTCNNQGGWSPDLMDERIERGPWGKAAVVNPVGQSYGIYKLPADRIPSNDYVADPVRLVDDPDVFEYGAIYAGPYADVYGKAQPDTVSQPRSADGGCYLRIASQASDTTSWDVANKRYHFAFDEHGAVHGKELPGVTDADVRFIRVSQILPQRTVPKNFAGQGAVKWTIWGLLNRTLGDVPVQADGSAHIRIPCEMPFVIQGLNANHEVIKRDMTPQSLRPGTTLTCGGCHLHNDVTPQPDFASSLAAARPAVDLTGVRPRPQPEYSRDIAPILHRRCGACHGPERPAGGIDFTAGKRTRYFITRDFEQKYNPVKLDVDPGPGVLYRLDRPLSSWLLDGAFSGRSRLYWYLVNERRDYADNTTWPTDFDFNHAHPKVAASPDEIATVREWIDTGALYDPAVPIPPFKAAKSNE
jgi:hypothetical protein